MLPYSARGVPVRMAFAKDLAIRASSRQATSLVTAKLSALQTGVFEEQRQETTTTVEAENDHDEAVDLVVELPRNANRTPADDAPAPVEETASYRRYAFTIPGHQKGSLAVREIMPIYRSYQYDSLAGEALEHWLKGRFLDDATFAALSGILGHFRRARSLEEQARRAIADRDAAYTKQTKISEQLRVLKDAGPEGDLRLRYVKELEAEQDRVNQSEAEWKRLQAEAEAERRAANDEIKALA